MKNPRVRRAVKKGRKKQMFAAAHLRGEGGVGGGNAPSGVRPKKIACTEHIINKSCSTYGIKDAFYWTPSFCLQ